ncbi:MAG: protein-export chaperone SecB [Cytophagales bacterium]|jgi:preprotein translocase subunit SecB|nr:protein-export chaperone SecB [Cytophagales bacterium]
MKPQLSPLILIDFAIINSSFKFIAPSDNSDIRQLVSEYQIDIDFAIIPEQANTRVFIKASVNQQETEIPGYSIFAEGVAVFNLSDKVALTEEDKRALLQYSAVSIALNSLRGFISSLTANAPFGRYTLPSIDVNDLFQQKAKIVQKKTTKRKQK